MPSTTSVHPAVLIFRFLFLAFLALSGLTQMALGQRSVSGKSKKSVSRVMVSQGNQATTTVTATSYGEFNGSVTLSCAGLPNDVTCSFDPASISNGTGTSTLTVTASAGAVAGTYPVTITGASGSLQNVANITLVVQPAPDFAIAPASGSPTSQTVNPGQGAQYSLVLTPLGSFSGAVSLSCGITPVVTPAPTCTLPSSVDVTQGVASSFSVTVSTTAAVAGSTRLSYTGLPPGVLRLAAVLLLLGAMLFASRCVRLPALGAAMIAFGIISFVSCGGGGSSQSSQSTPGTPAGTYTTTITATSGSLNHGTTVKLIVQ